MKIRQKMWPLVLLQGFPIILPSDLVFDPTLPSFELVQDFLETNILAKIYNDWAKNVASNALTRIFYDLT